MTEGGGEGADGGNDKVEQGRGGGDENEDMPLFNLLPCFTYYERKALKVNKATIMLFTSC